MNDIYVGLTLKQTSSNHPEQYNVIDSYGNVVGFTDFQDTVFSAYCPAAHGECVFLIQLGISLDDSFASDMERTLLLNTAKLCVANKIYKEINKAERRVNEPE